jgi:hypothetical protein
MMASDKKRISAQTLEDAGKAYLIQRHQQRAVDNAAAKIRQGLDDLAAINDNNIAELEALLAQSENMLKASGINTDGNDYGGINTSEIYAQLSITETEKAAIKRYDFGSIDRIIFTDDISWQEYLANIDRYAENYQINLAVDPFKELMTPEDYAELAKRVKEDYALKKANCDKYDYIIAAASGVVCGLIDAFFVGMPGASKLGNWTDKMADSLVEKFTDFVFKADQKTGNALQKKVPEGIAGCIGYLERRFKINYDARYASDLGLTQDQLSMAPINHHLKSLGHAPDLIGLFFSLLDQFTNTTSIISDGQIIRIENVNGNFRLHFLF